MTEMQCRCRACIRAGASFDGISCHPEMHVVLDDAPARETTKHQPPPAPALSRDTIRSEIWQFTKDRLVPAIARETMTRQRASDKRIAALEAELDAMRATMSQIKFAGAWEDGKSYHPGNITTHGGSSFVCLADTASEKPGTGLAWSLLAAKGRDGRDGKDAPILPDPPDPPMPRVARGPRSQR